MAIAIKERIKGVALSFKWLRLAIYIICFTGVFYFLSRYDNYEYETERMRQSCFAFMFLLVAMMAMQKVELLNWQSLVLTVVYAPVAIWKCSFYKGSEDLLLTNIFDSISLWIALLIVVDMIVTGRVRAVKKIHWSVFFLFGTMIVFLVQFPRLIFIDKFFYLFLICLIPMCRKDWDEVMDGFIIAGLVSFIIIAVISFIVNPVFGVSKDAFMEKNPNQGGRWYGAFLNIGAFGQFLGLSTALSICGIYRSKDLEGKGKIAGIIISVIWLLASVFLAVFNGTRNYLLGVGFLLVVLFVFGWHKSSTKAFCIRSAIVLLLITLVIVGLVYLGKYVMSPAFDSDKLTGIAMNTPLKYAPAGVNYTIEILEKTHNGEGTGYYGKDIFPADSIWRFFNMLSSNRIGICLEFLSKSTWNGGQSDGIQYGWYFAYNAHNQYVQSIYEYGFLAGGVYILFVIVAWIISLINSVKIKHTHFFITMIVVTMMLGMWFGERSTINYPLTFAGIFITYPIIVDTLSNKGLGEK